MPVTLFLWPFLIRASHRANVFLAKEPVLFLRGMVAVYGTAVEMNEKNLVTDLAPVQDKSLQLKVGPLALPCSAPGRTDLLKHDYTFLEVFVVPVRAPSKIQSALILLDSFGTATLKDLE